MILHNGILSAETVAPAGQRFTSDDSGPRWLVDDEQTPGASGLLAIQILDAGASLPTEPLEGESAAVVLAGSAGWHAGDRAESLGPGDGVFWPAGSRRHLSAITDGTCLLLLYGRRRQSFDLPGAGEKGARDRGACWRYVRPGRPGTGVLQTVGGFSDMGVQWLVTTGTVGSVDLVVATSTFEPGGNHALHRHPDADEFFLVLDGGGQHRSPDGPVHLGVADLVFVPAGEWHGYCSDPGTATRAIYGYLGAGCLEQAGYEVMT